jgi:hypothetical protein
MSVAASFRNSAEGDEQFAGLLLTRAARSDSQEEPGYALAEIEDSDASSQCTGR